MSKRGSKNVQDVILNSNEQDFSSRVLLDDSEEGTSCQPVNANFTSMQSTDMHQFSSPFSCVDQDLPSGTAPLVTLSNSPVTTLDAALWVSMCIIWNAGNMPLPPPGDIVFRHRQSSFKTQGLGFFSRAEITKRLLPCLEDMHSFMFYGF